MHDKIKMFSLHNFCELHACAHTHTHTHTHNHSIRMYLLQEENESNLTTGGEDSEKAPVSDDVQADNTKDVFSNMSSSEIQSVLNKVVSKTMESFRTEVGKKISSSEKAHLGRLTHFEKTIQN